MKKLPTLFSKDPNDLSRIIPSDPLFSINELTFRIKLDGTACFVKDGKPYVRYDAKLIKRKRGKVVKVLNMDEVVLPDGAIACQEPDTKSGHWPHWIPLTDDPQYANHLKGFLNSKPTQDGSYECIGPGINANPHGEEKCLWVWHKDPRLLMPWGPGVTPWVTDWYEELGAFLKTFPWEGLVAYKDDDSVAKIRRKDYGHSSIEFNKVSELLNFYA